MVPVTPLGKSSCCLPPVDVAFEHAELLQDLHGNSAGREIVYCLFIQKELRIQNPWAVMEKMDICNTTSMAHSMHVWYTSILPEKKPAMHVGK